MAHPLGSARREPDLHLPPRFDWSIRLDYPTPETAAVPEPARAAAQRMATTLVEVLGGRRPTHQVQVWLSASEMAQLVHWIGRHRGQPIQLAGLSMHTSDASTVEAVARFSTADHHLAVAYQICREARGWHCRTLSPLLPGWGPQGAIPRWGYDRGTS